MITAKQYIYLFIILLFINYTAWYYTTIYNPLAQRLRSISIYIYNIKLAPSCTDVCQSSELYIGYTSTYFRMRECSIRYIRRRTARMHACNRRIRRRTACNVVYCAFIYILYIISISVQGPRKQGRCRPILKKVLLNNNIGQGCA